MGSLMIARRYWQSSSNGPLARRYCGSSSNGPLIHRYCECQWRQTTNVRTSVATVGQVATVGGNSSGPLMLVPIAAMGASSNRIYATCPTVATVR
jgi:hypothetical protein